MSQRRHVMSQRRQQDSRASREVELGALSQRTGAQQEEQQRKLLEEPAAVETFARSFRFLAAQPRSRKPVDPKQLEKTAPFLDPSGKEPGPLRIAWSSDGVPGFESGRIAFLWRYHWSVPAYWWLRGLIDLLRVVL